MADISLKRTHKLGLKGAHWAADKMAEKLAEKFDLKGAWRGDTLNFTRSGVNGTLVVTDHDMKLDISLGFLLKMMKGPIENAVHENLDKVLKEGAAKPTPKPAATVAKKPVAKKK